MVMHQEERNRPSPHIVSHCDIHQNQKKTYREYQPPDQLWRLSVLQGILFRRQLRACAFLLNRFFPGRRAITGVLHCPDNFRISRRPVHSHGICKQRNRYRGNPRHLCHSFFHMGLTGRACHSRYRKLLHKSIPLFRRLISSASAAPHTARLWSHPFLPGYHEPHSLGYDIPEEPC